MKRILAVLLSVFMVLCNISVDAHAESIVEEEPLQTVEEVEKEVDDVNGIVDDESTLVDEIEESIDGESSTPCGTLQLKGLALSRTSLATR